MRIVEARVRRYELEALRAEMGQTSAENGGAQHCKLLRTRLPHFPSLPAPHALPTPLSLLSPHLFARRNGFGRPRDESPALAAHDRVGGVVIGVVEKVQQR